MTTEQVKEQLQNLAEDDYKAFNENLLPGVKHILGVRLPILRKIAKEIAKTDSRVYLNEAAETVGAESFYEELMVQGLVIGYAKLKQEERVRYLDEFIPKIQSWGFATAVRWDSNLCRKNRNSGFLIYESIKTVRLNLNFVFIGGTFGTLCRGSTLSTRSWIFAIRSITRDIM